MSDENIRRLERDAKRGDTGAAEALRTACARAGHIRTGYAVFKDATGVLQGEICPRCAAFTQCPDACFIHDHMSLIPEALRRRMAAGSARTTRSSWRPAPR